MAQPERKLLVEEYRTHLALLGHRTVINGHRTLQHAHRLVRI